MTGTYNRANSAVSYEIMKMIEANGQKSGEYWIYNDGWSDDRIATELKASLSAIEYRRKEVFGMLRQTRTIGGDWRPEVDRLTTENQAFRVDMFRIKQRVEALEKALSLFSSGAFKDRVPDERLKALKNHLEGQQS